MMAGRPRKYTSREDIERELNTCVEERCDLSERIEELMEQAIAQKAILRRLREKRHRITVRINKLEHSIKYWDSTN